MQNSRPSPAPSPAPSATPSQPRSPATAITLVAALLLAIAANTLFSGFGKPGGWLIVEDGRPKANEYIGVRAAGELVREGRASEAYDMDIHQARQDTIAGEVTGLKFPWPYPPTYFAVAVLLTSVPVLTGALLWLGLTLGGYLWVVVRITGVRVTALWAAAVPSTLINAVVAHTGFWTAGLMGHGLSVLPTRPVLAGLCFGMLSMKPQLGLLIPVALLAGGHWRALSAAAATALTMAALSVAAFGLDPWFQWLAQLARISGVIRDLGIHMELLATLYGFLRGCGLSHAAALSAQAILALGAATSVAALWRSEADMHMKAAGLIAAGMVATPYLFIYDLTLLPIGAAFLVRHTGVAGLKGTDVAALAGATVLLFLAANVLVPAGFFATVLFGAIVLRRAWPYLALTNLWSRSGRPSMA